jgi:hypothetical protein
MRNPLFPYLVFKEMTTTLGYIPKAVLASSLSINGTIAFDQHVAEVAYTAGVTGPFDSNTTMTLVKSGNQVTLSLTSIAAQATSAGPAGTDIGVIPPSFLPDGVLANNRTYMAFVPVWNNSSVDSPSSGMLTIYPVGSFRVARAH